MAKNLKIFDLDFTLLPVVDTKRPIIYQLGSDRENALKNFSQVLERADSSLFFSAKFHGEGNEIIKKSFLRAAISEFVSIEEVVSLDLLSNSIPVSPLKIRHIPNPLHHIIKQLRNFNIHLGSSAIEYTESKTIIRGTDDDLKNGTGLHYQDKEPIISNLNINEFNKLKDANKYSTSDKIQMIDWFNLNQQHWGVGHLIYLANQVYCDNIIKYYNLT